MEYTGRSKTMYSEECGEDVTIFEYASQSKYPYCECSMCGKPLIRKMYVVQSDATDIELAYLGPECIRRLT